MLHSLEHVRDHQNSLTDTAALPSCQAPQLGCSGFAAKKVYRHRAPKHGTLAYYLYHIWELLEVGITSAREPDRIGAILAPGGRSGLWQGGRRGGQPEPSQDLEEIPGLE